MTEAGSRWIDALPGLARQRLPAPVWQYFVTGADEGVSVAEAVAAWRRVRLAPHVLRDVTAVDTSAVLFGTTYAQPFGIAPTSMQRAADPEGERAMARAATAAGVPHVVSSNAGFPLAEIGAVGPWWVQAYLTAHRADALPVLRRPPTRVRRRSCSLRTLPSWAPSEVWTTQTGPTSTCPGTAATSPSMCATPRACGRGT